MSVAHETGARSGGSGEILLAYNLTGHRRLSQKAINGVLEVLPKDLAWMRIFLKDTPQSVVHRDVADVFSRAHWKKAGQKHHFMRHKTQSQTEAYNAGVGWIRDNALLAANNLKKRVNRPGGPVGRMPTPTHQVTEPLGNAFHALQDSFAEGHVTRSEFNVITTIHVYDDANQEAREGWKGHGALDKNWDSPLGSDAVLGCKLLTLNVIEASLAESQLGLKTVWNSSWTEFKLRFLKTTATAKV